MNDQPEGNKDVTTAQAAAQCAPQLRTIGRPDTLTAQRVEVAIVLHAMLGESAAAEYLDKHRVPSYITRRVLAKGSQRRGSHNEHGVRTSSAC